MTVMEITSVVVIKSLWWMVPAVGGWIASVILEMKGVL